MRAEAIQSLHIEDERRVKRKHRELLLAIIVGSTRLAAQTPDVARVVVTPAAPEVVVGMPLQLEAQAIDSSGRTVAGATIRCQRAFGIFEGGVDQDGLVTRTMSVSRHFIVTAGREAAMNGAPASSMAGSHESMTSGDPTCQPTWAQPSADGSRISVACNTSSEIVEVDSTAWRLLRRMPAQPGVCNLGITHDGKRLLATNERDQSVSVIDLAIGKELTRAPTTRKIVSGVTVSVDDRYAFAAIEGSGAQPGTMDVVDLNALAKVASIGLGQQAGGIDFWKSEPPRLSSRR